MTFFVNISTFTQVLYLFSWCLYFTVLLNRDILFISVLSLVALKIILQS